MLTSFQPAPENRSSAAIDAQLSALYDSNVYHKKLIDRLRTFYVYAQSGKLTLSRRHGRSLTSLYFSDGTLIQIETNDPEVSASPGHIEKTILQLLGWKDAQLDWTPDVYPEERPLAYEINLLFKEIDRIRQSKRTQNWGTNTCRLIVEDCRGKAHLPVNLQILGEGGDRYQYTLVSERALLGRDPGQVHLFIPSMALSRKHAAIQVCDSGIYIQDLGSRNGSYINDQQLTPHMYYPVGETDRVWLANYELKFQPTTEAVSEALKVKAQSQLRRLKRHMQHWDPTEALEPESAPPPGFRDTEPVPKT